MNTDHTAPSVICLMGPTASGKTDLAVRLVETFPCEIVSVDSALVYKGMDIGTAKPDEALLKKAPHRLINLIEPEESYSVARFQKDAYWEIQAIHQQGKIPLLVGGTMMYFNALMNGLAQLPDADPEVRADLDKQALRHGLHTLHKQLATIDPHAAARIHPNDSQRIQRAIEVWRITGQSLTALQAKAQAQMPPYRFVQFGIAPADRKILHERIAKRFHQMLEQGFVSEVEALRRHSSLDKTMPSMRCVGYRQIWDYLEGIGSYDEMRQKGIVATRQLAKRQLTWLRSMSELHWLQLEEPIEKTLEIIQTRVFD
ncbi:MAG: tRNA (adenosine(37)-N6)-dimethylallyltransferase MiaA [Gammaproteobacteria bacterium]|nr:tRNA (adenosine(37)-N6)-dimethylallyltransferase MiaA [Gammaproteobacteria bacterium]